LIQNMVLPTRRSMPSCLAVGAARRDRKSRSGF
jgi:hypothetical protein